MVARPSPEKGQKWPQSGRPKALTSLPPRIHCVATADAAEADEPESEMDRLAVDTFIEALADIALAVARRTKGARQ